jgi:hypothetical protein
MPRAMRARLRIVPQLAFSTVLHSFPFVQRECGAQACTLMGALTTRNRAQQDGGHRAKDMRGEREAAVLGAHANGPCGYRCTGHSSRTVGGGTRGASSATEDGGEARADAAAATMRRRM